MPVYFIHECVSYKLPIRTVRIYRHKIVPIAAVLFDKDDAAKGMIAKDVKKYKCACNVIRESISQIYIANITALLPMNSVSSHTFCGTSTRKNR